MRTLNDRLVLACCAFYFFLGSLWISKPGLQADEILFTQPLFDPLATAESISIFHHPVPLMIMSYLGCLKTLLYWPLIRLYAGSSPETLAAVIRLPMVAAGALTIWITYRIVARIHSERAGAIAAVLLATDTLYLWLSRCDWGPVTLQHLLALSGVWMLLRFRDGQRAAWLCGACFLFGLALWDKTVFLWPAAALLAGGVLLWREIAPLITLRRVGLALVFFALGAFPWIRYNVRQPGGTFQETAHFSTEAFREKAQNFVGGLNGRMLLGYMIAERGPRELAPQGPAAASMVGAAKILSFPRQSIAGWVFLGALLASPLLGRTARVVAAMMIAGFLLMAFTKGGGQWPYHSSILWPLPHILMALLLVRLPKTWLVAAVSVIALASLAVTNTHFALLHQYGGSTIWTEAVYRLPEAIASAQSQARNDVPAQVLDWGILEPIQLLSDAPVEGKQKAQYRIGHTPLPADAIYVGHVAGSEIFPSSNADLVEDARKAGCRLRTVETVPNSLGVPIFQLQVCE
jgi:Dolichyl-phosphate-mannose-protein mannosyltransferase